MTRNTWQVFSIDPVELIAGELPSGSRDWSKLGLHTSDWPNGRTVDPETLHDWLQLAEALTARARQWEQAAAQAPQ